MSAIGPHTVTYRPRHWVGKRPQHPTVSVHLVQHHSVELELADGVVLAERLLGAVRRANNLTDDERLAQERAGHEGHWLQIVYEAIMDRSKGDRAEARRLASSLADLLLLGGHDERP